MSDSYFSESDLNLMYEVLSLFALDSTGTTKQRIERLADHAMLLREDIRLARNANVAPLRLKARKAAEANIRWREKREREKQHFFDQHPAKERGPWIIRIPEEDREPTFMGIDVGTWESVAHWAWGFVDRGETVGLPIVERIK